MDDVSFELLKLYAQRDKLSIKDISAILNHNARSITEPVMYLVNMEYLRQHKASGDTGLFDTSYSITHVGRIALEEEQKIRRHFRYTELRAWITLGIAIIALMISVISLLLQIL